MPEPPDRPPIAQSPLSVVLLAAAHEPALESRLDDWLRALADLRRDYEVFLLEAAGTEASRGRLAALAAAHPPLRHVPTGDRHGIGAALRAGVAAARHPLFLYAECSPRYQPGDVSLLLDVIDQVDLVAGYRVGPPGERVRGLGSYLYTGFTRFGFGVHLRDVDCAFKLCRREIFARIPIQSDGRFAQAEIVAKANFLTCLLTEVPVAYRPSLTSPVLDAEPFFARTWKEAGVVFREPDFGPAILPQTPQTQAP